MPLVNGSIKKLGFGLWRSAICAYIVEEILLLTGLVIYLKATKPVGRFGKHGMTTLAISALLSYFLLAATTFWLDGKRI